MVRRRAPQFFPPGRTRPLKNPGRFQTNRPKQNAPKDAPWESNWPSAVFRFSIVVSESPGKALSPPSNEAPFTRARRPQKFNGRRSWEKGRSRKSAPSLKLQIGPPSHPPVLGEEKTRDLGQPHYSMVQASRLSGRFTHGPRFGKHANFSKSKWERGPLAPPRKIHARLHEKKWHALACVRRR